MNWKDLIRKVMPKQYDWKVKSISLEESGKMYSQDSYLFDVVFTHKQTGELFNRLHAVYLINSEQMVTVLDDSMHTNKELPDLPKIELQEYVKAIPKTRYLEDALLGSKIALYIRSRANEEEKV